MKSFLEYIGRGICILALAIGLKGCIEDKPFIGEHGSFIDTFHTVTSPTK